MAVDLTEAREVASCLRNDPAYGDDAAHQIGILAAEVERLLQRNAAMRKAMARILPSMGWRGTASHPDMYRCEFCGVQHEDCFKLPHTDACAFREATDALEGE